MFHLSAYFLAIANVADTDVPFLSDQILTRNNNHLVLRKRSQLLGAAVMGATVSRAKLVSPTLRQIANPFIRPLIGAVKPATNPNMMLLDHMGLYIPAFEEVQLLATDTTGTTDNLTALLWLADTIEPAPPGQLTPLRFTGTTAAVANAWSDEPIAFVDSIPSGRYLAVMSEVQSAQGIAHRWIFSGQEYRPGYFSYTNLTDRHPNTLYRFPFGLMGRFASNDLPRLQVLCNGADAAFEGYLWVQKLSDSIA